MLQAMAGFDPKDSTSVEQPVDDYLATLNQPLNGLRIGLPREYFGAGLDGRIAETVLAVVEELKKLGATVKDISLPTMQHAIPAYYVIAPAEASSNLSRFDGVRFGYRCENPVNLEDLYKRSRGEGFGAEVKRRIMIGTYALSAGYYDAYYLKAQKVRTLIKADFDALWAQGFDALVAPTSPTVAFRFGERLADPVSMYLSDACTLPVNMAGLPGISIPCGLSEGLPVGLQLIGAPWSEAALLRLARGYEGITATADWRAIEPTGLSLAADPSTPTPRERAA
jgi:aspartyl-tRNA(Asn)/glutamyl-tRNA(Gln) amidotransferase subunit A